jgi:hypothetical protein
MKFTNRVRVEPCGLRCPMAMSRSRVTSIQHWRRFVVDCGCPKLVENFVVGSGDLTQLGVNVLVGLGELGQGVDAQKEFLRLFVVDVEDSTSPASSSVSACQ